MASERFEDGIYGRLDLLGEVTKRAMFSDRLYLKVDERSKADFKSTGMDPFRSNDRQPLKSHKEPSVVLDDPEALLSWDRESIRAGMASQSPDELPFDAYLPEIRRTILDRSLNKSDDDRR